MNFKPLRISSILLIFLALSSCNPRKEANLEEVPAVDHPLYKRVYLRMLPVDAPTGTGPGVIAYLYGGQGTINVPGWSPDSKKIAFVSNGIFK